jgi:hypothetical protein
MAEPGFPWQAESHVREPTYLDEKAAAAAHDTAPPKAALGDVSNKSTPHHSLRPHSHSIGKRKCAPVKSQSSFQSPTKPSPEPRISRSGVTQLPVRTIPPWVRDAEESDVEEYNQAQPDSPSLALIAQHNHSPSTARTSLLTPDRHHRLGHTTVSGQLRPERTSRWISFARASAYPREVFESEKMDPEWLDANFTDYSKPWLADHKEEDGEDGSGGYRAFRRKRRVWYKRVQFTVLRNPFVPLAFRFTVIAFALIATGLGASIYHETGRIVHCIEQPQDNRDDYCDGLLGDHDGPIDYYRDPAALMAIIVDVIAVVYSIYITYDEYFSKPLGLRKARAKVRLVLLDLFFIVFQSANLSLSFESLTVEEGACQVGDTDQTATRFDNVCERSKALSSVLVVSLVAWMMTFSVSILR